jgi:hypothetical protein
MTSRTFVLALTLIFVIGVALAFSGPGAGTWWLVTQFAAVIAVSGAFGGIVHGLLARTRVKYKIALPRRELPSEEGNMGHRELPPEERDIGIWGDVLIGAAAGMALFLVIDSLFGLKVREALTDPQMLLKIVALGVLSGYLGMPVLENLSVMFSKRLTNAQIDLDKTVEEAQQLQARIKAASRARQLTPLGDGYRRWEMWDEALNVYDEAIRIEPNSAENYLQKSFVYADQAEAALKELKAAGADTEKAKAAQEKANRMYDNAILLAEKAVDVDKVSARAFYDRACYKHKRRVVPDKEVFDDLATAFGLDDIMRKLAKADPDFSDLLSSPDFKKLVDKDVVPPHTGMAPTLRDDTKSKTSDAPVAA